MAAKRTTDYFAGIPGDNLFTKLCGSLARAADDNWVEPQPICEPLPSAYMARSAWLSKYYPYATRFPMAPHHEDWWNWIEGISPGVRPKPYIVILARGGGKSVGLELGIVRLGTKLSRRFCLIVCGTQDAADKHVTAIATFFERLGVERALNEFGNPKGWRRNVLRVANGFNVQGLGLDVNVRGIKFDEFRPDAIFFDDVDDHPDTPRIVEKKRDIITRSILPAASIDCAVGGVQNLIHEDSLFSQLVDGRADFLRDRIINGPHPAIIGLKYERVREDREQAIYKITDGVATWEGQNIQTCENYMNTEGLRAFLIEAQHEVAGGDGYVFLTSMLGSVELSDVPQIDSVCQRWDLAATEGAGDATASGVMGRGSNGCYYIFGVVDGHWSVDRVNSAIDLTATAYKKQFPELKIGIPQDPSQAGKWQAQFMKRDHAEHSIITRSIGSQGKIARGRMFVDEVNKGNVFLVKQDLPSVLKDERGPKVGGHQLMNDTSWVRWHMIVKDHLRRIREDTPNQEDDIYDALTDCYAGIRAKRMGRAA